MISVFTPREFVYKKSAATQPLKGVCLFGGAYEDRDYSMVYCGAYFHNLYRIEVIDGEYTGVLQNDRIEELLSRVAQSGRTAVLRPVAFEGDIKLDDNFIALLAQNGDLYESRPGRRYPNWNSDIIVKYFLDFIEKFAESYDGDPRIACIQMGLYGEFGEWNLNSVLPKHFDLVRMPNSTIEKLVSQYCKCFKKTKLQSRNPNFGHARNYPIGYHDDNFVFNSADYHTPGWDNMQGLCSETFGEGYVAYTQLHQFEDFIYGNGLQDNWKDQMMGAEISGCLGFKTRAGANIYGNMFEGECLKALEYNIEHFHITFSLGWHRGGGALPRPGSGQYDNFKRAALDCGYDFTVTGASYDDGKLTVRLKNAGIAPIYYNWKTELAVADQSFSCDADITKILPGDELLLVYNIGNVKGDVRFRIVNPLVCAEEKRFPLILSNEGVHGEYFTIGKVE